MKKKHVIIAGIVLILLAVIVFLWLPLALKQERFTREFIDIQKISKALECYASKFEGHLPTSWDDLARTRIIELLDDSKGFYIIEMPESISGGDWTVSNRDKYKIAFGTAPETITINDRDVVGADGKLVLLIAPVGETLVGEDHYRWGTKEIALGMKKYAKVTDKVTTPKVSP